MTLEELKRLSNDHAVSKGEWRHEVTTRPPHPAAHGISCTIGYVVPPDYVSKADAALIAAMRNELHNLIAAVEALELVKHATAPEPNDGGYHEAAYMIASEALKRLGVE